MEIVMLPDENGVMTAYRKVSIGIVITDEMIAELERGANEGDALRAMILEHINCKNDEDDFDDEGW